MLQKVKYDAVNTDSNIKKVCQLSNSNNILKTKHENK